MLLSNDTKDSKVFSISKAFALALTKVDVVLSSANSLSIVVFNIFSSIAVSFFTAIATPLIILLSIALTSFKSFINKSFLQEPILINRLLQFSFNPTYVCGNNRLLFLIYDFLFKYSRKYFRHCFKICNIKK